MNELIKLNFATFFIQNMFEHICGKTFNEQEADVVLNVILKYTTGLSLFTIAMDMSTDNLIEGWLNFILTHMLIDKGCFDY